MSAFFEKMYDEMELEEVICRLPSELAIESIKRRIKSLEDIKNFMSRPDAGGASKVKEIKQFINDLISNSSAKNVFETFPPEYHPTLFGWLTKECQRQLLTSGREYFTIEFLFNATEPNNLEQLLYILDKTIKDKDIPKINSVLRKVDTKHFQTLLAQVLKSNDPEIRSVVLSIADASNYNTISDHQKMIALKAFAKLPESFNGSGYINKIDFRLFQDLKPLERIMALDRYLNYFPTYRKIKVFNPEPTEDEFNLILFAGCFEFNDLVEGIKNKYDKITKLDQPDEESI